ncbi:pumilio homolog 12-like [Primulina eburnea]|uniref:pumilio homolog 12-like n=1 Tax=Primulina eburnea TaxID=1245227 RepID=UPI003C6C8BA0
MDDDNNTSSGDTGTGRFEDFMFSKAMKERGCQLLLQKLHERKVEDIQMIFSEVKDCICQLMFDQFGSDVILKLFEVCNEEQKNQLVSAVTADPLLLISVCIDPQGSETMQKFLGFPMEQKQISRIMRFFKYFVVPLANHPSGSQVIAECFKIFPCPAEETQPMLHTIACDCLELAVDENGSSILKILLSSYERDIVERILSNTIYLSTDEYGSSVIQHLIGLEKPYVLQRLVDEMQEFFTFLCYTNKYGTDVVKKLIVASRAKYAPQIISQMINDPCLLAALADPHGYSLLKYAKKYAKGTDLKTLNDMICQYSQPLKKK